MTKMTDEELEQALEAAESQLPWGGPKLRAHIAALTAERDEWKQAHDTVKANHENLGRFYRDSRAENDALRERVKALEAERNAMDKERNEAAFRMEAAESRLASIRQRVHSRHGLGGVIARYTGRPGPELLKALERYILGDDAPAQASEMDGLEGAMAESSVTEVCFAAKGGKHCAHWNEDGECCVCKAIVPENCQKGCGQAADDHNDEACDLATERPGEPATAQAAEAGGPCRAIPVLSLDEEADRAMSAWIAEQPKPAEPTTAEAFATVRGYVTDTWDDDGGNAPLGTSRTMAAISLLERRMGALALAARPFADAGVECLRRAGFDGSRPDAKFAIAVPLDFFRALNSALTDAPEVYTREEVEAALVEEERDVQSPFTIGCRLGIMARLAALRSPRGK